MSSAPRRPAHVPLIALAYGAYRAMAADMVSAAHRAGHSSIKQTHNAIFATLGVEGMRAVDMAARLGITRQSMGEIIREMVGLGILEMRPDPTDRRAKLVVYSEEGLRIAADGFAHIEELDRRFTEEFGEEDYQTARRVLRRVAQLLKEEA
jgi:DNA-binding MarR family transcriptional regulator